MAREINVAIGTEIVRALTSRGRVDLARRNPMTLTTTTTSTTRMTPTPTTTTTTYPNGYLYSMRGCTPLLGTWNGGQPQQAVGRSRHRRRGAALRSVPKAQEPLQGPVVKVSVMHVRSGVCGTDWGGSVDTIGGVSHAKRYSDHVGSCA